MKFYYPNLLLFTNISFLLTEFEQRVEIPPKFMLAYSLNYSKDFPSKLTLDKLSVLFPTQNSHFPLICLSLLFFHLLNSFLKAKQATTTHNIGLDFVNIWMTSTLLSIYG